MTSPMSFNDVRRDQRMAGISMSRVEGTINRPTVRKPAEKAKPKGHEAFLKQLEASGATIEVIFVGGNDKVTGKVKCSDKYTITVKTANGIDRVLFKHDLREFRSLQPKGEELQ